MDGCKTVSDTVVEMLKSIKKQSRRALIDLPSGGVTCPVEASPAPREGRDLRELKTPSGHEIIKPLVLHNTTKEIY